MGSARSQSGCGVSNSARSVRSDFGAGTRVMAILSLSTKSSSRFKGNTTIFGGQLTRTATLWMFFCSAAGTAGQQSVSSNALLRRSGNEPRRVVTDKLRSYCVAHRELIPDTIHDTSQYANNRAELSHQPTRVRERGMRRFKSPHQAQRFLSTHAAVYNLFNLGRHLISAKHYRFFRARSLPLGYSAPLRLGNVWRPHKLCIHGKSHETIS